MASENKTNVNGLAIYETLRANEGATLALIEITSKAGIPNESGYLTAARALAKKDGYKIEKIEKAVEAEAEIVTTYPSGVEVRKTKKVIADGYRLIKA